jgi:hypothetical protein
MGEKASLTGVLKDLELAAAAWTEDRAATRLESRVSVNAMF